MHCCWRTKKKKTKTMTMMIWSVESVDCGGTRSWIVESDGSGGTIGSKRSAHPREDPLRGRGRGC